MAGLARPAPPGGVTGQVGVVVVAEGGRPVDPLTRRWLTCPLTPPPATPSPSLCPSRISYGYYIYYIMVIMVIFNKNITFIRSNYY